MTTCPVLETHKKYSFQEWKCSAQGWIIKMGMHWDEVLGETFLGAYLYDAPFLGLTPLIPRFVTLIGNYYKSVVALCWH